MKNLFLKIIPAFVLCLLLLASCREDSKNKQPADDSTTPEAANAQIVTPGSFARAESDMYFNRDVKTKDNLGRFHHGRDIVTAENQTVVRSNRDVLVSTAVFDFDAGPVTITVPDPGRRFLSILVVNEDHYNPLAAFGGGTYSLTKDNVGTRYAQVVLRLFADPNDPKDMEIAHSLQDKVRVVQAGGPGRLQTPKWDKASQDRIRDSLLIAARSIKDFPNAFGRKDQVDPSLHLIATAAGWGGNPSSVAVYKNFTPAGNDGTAIYKLHVPADVPVDAFWSISVYNAKGFFEKNDLDVYNLNSVTSKKNKDGSVDIQFGGCEDKTPNCIPVVKGWNYIVRLYRPHKEILERGWKFPEAVELPK